MLDHLRRRPAALLLIALLPAGLALTACGDDNEPLKGFDAVSIGGQVGSTPKLDWKGTLAAGKAQGKVVTKGDGAKIAKGDVVQIDFTMANGFTHKISYDTHDDFTVGTLITVGADKEPASIADLLTEAVVDQIKPGQTIGSRIAVTIGSDKLLGDYLGNEQVSQFAASLDIGNEDGLLFVADLTSLAGPSGTAQKAAPWAPKIVEKDGVPTSFDFKGAPAPSGKLEVSTVIKGNGPVVKRGQKILASYLGQIPKGAKPFDLSYDDGTGLEATLGGDAATVVKGWSRGLIGLPVGSRVLLQIPPSLGYGKEAQGEDIPANSTLYFIVDILDVADPEPPAPAPSITPEPADPTEPTAPVVPTDPAAPSESASVAPSETATTKPSATASE